MVGDYDDDKVDDPDPKLRAAMPEPCPRISFSAFLFFLQQFLARCGTSK